MWKRLLRWLLRLALIGIVLGAAAFGLMWKIWEPQLPNVANIDLLALGGKTRVYDRQNRLIGVLNPSIAGGAVLSGELLEIGEISQPMRKAVLSSEDRRFFQHGGIDPIGIARGLLKGLLLGDLEGGSTITQQLVKNTLLGELEGARTLERKFKEMILAQRVEQHFDKNQILAAYLNVVYFGQAGGRSIVGIDAAAHAYFDKPASDLTLPESLYLASLIPSPNTRYKEFEAIRPVQQSILKRLVEDGRYTQAQANKAWRTPFYPAGWRIGWNEDGSIRSAALENPARLAQQMPELPPSVAFHYLQAVERELVQAIGREKLYTSAKIITGLDLEQQLAAEAVARAAEVPEGATLGMAFVDTDTGEVRALVGQKLYNQRPADWDNATQARRQVGSAIKPFVYTLALSRGWKQDDTVLDSPLEGDYQPSNYNGRWLGYPVTLRYALDHSLNLPTVRLAQEVGLSALEGKLSELGFEVAPNLGLSLSIGTLEASPLQMAAAYAAFANGGLYHPPSFVRQVIDDSGAITYQRPQIPTKRVWDERTAFLGLDMMLGVVNDLSEAQGGLATRARIEGWPVGGKTGTTNDIRDLWFAGVVPGLSGAVWVGREDNQPLPSWAYSGTVPTPIWQQAMSGMLAGRTPSTFNIPAGIEYARVRRVDMAFRSENIETDWETTAPNAPNWWDNIVDSINGGNGGNDETDQGEATAPPAAPYAEPDTPYDSPQDLPQDLQDPAEWPDSGDQAENGNGWNGWNDRNDWENWEDDDEWEQSPPEPNTPYLPPELVPNGRREQLREEAERAWAEQQRKAEERFRKELERGRTQLEQQLEQQLQDLPQGNENWREELERSLEDAVGPLPFQPLR